MNKTNIVGFSDNVNHLTDSSPSHSLSPQYVNPFEYTAERRSLLGNVAYFTDHSVIVYDNCVEIFRHKSENYHPEPPERKPDDIVAFSKHSRLRLMRIMSKVNLNAYYKPVFFTSTFHDVFPESGKKLKIFLDNFLKRVARFDIQCHWIWRLEFQKRGAPHFHFIFFPQNILNSYSYIRFQRFLLSAWNSSLCDASYKTFLHSCKFDVLDSSKKAMIYVSKYCAKENNEIDKRFSGRRWGYSAALNQDVLSVHNVTAAALERIALGLFEIVKQWKNASDFFGEVILNADRFTFKISSTDFYRLFRAELKEQRPPPQPLVKKSNWYDRSDN